MIMGFSAPSSRQQGRTLARLSRCCRPSTCCAVILMFLAGNSTPKLSRGRVHVHRKPLQPRGALSHAKRAKRPVRWRSQACPCCYAACASWIGANCYETTAWSASEPHISAYVDNRQTCVPCMAFFLPHSSARNVSCAGALAQGSVPSPSLGALPIFTSITGQLLSVTSGRQDTPPYFVVVRIVRLGPGRWTQAGSDSWYLRVRAYCPPSMVQSVSTQACSHIPACCGLLMSCFCRFCHHGRHGIGVFPPMDACRLARQGVKR